MTENEWLTCNDPRPMLTFLQGKASDRKLRLFGCACCRRIWRLIQHEACRNAIEVAERCADGLVSLNECQVKGDAASEVGANSREFLIVVISNAVSWAASTRPREWNSDDWSLSNAVEYAAYHAALVYEDSSVEKAQQSSLIRDIFGNPFQSFTPLEFAVLAWNNRTVIRIAEGISSERAFDRMPILHDALLDAGCNHEALLSHCRNPEDHVRGCWALDLILAKE
jgi:hypothetical protein